MKKEVKQEILKDPRFAHVLRDPRFKPLRKEQVKVKIDKRFQSMFHDKKFQVKSKIDKRGRPISLNSTEDLKRFYEVSESDSDEKSQDDDDDDNDSDDKESEESKDKDDGKKKLDEKEKHESEDEKSSEEGESDTDESEEEKSGESGSDSEDEEKKLELQKEEGEYLTPEIKEKLQNLSVDYARGQDLLFSDSSSDEESSEDEDDELAHDWGELDKDAEHTEESTSRLAICNMNWDRAKAVDLMVLFHSFLPAGGLIHSITIYPSEYGLKKINEEEAMGPSELREIRGEDEDGKVSQEAMEKLRIYQLNRLKYYYAIALCDSAETANALYKACDGLEYECSSNKLDLRFVPEDMTFDQEPRETCTSLPDLSTYKPRLFQTKALTHSKAELTWDETDPDRQDAVKLAHSGMIKEDQLKMYLASSSEDEDESESVPEAKEEENSKDADEEETEKGSLDKYKALLAEIESKEKKNSKNKVDLEVTWNLGLEKKANELVKGKLKGGKSLTPFEQFLEKRKEKRKKRREEKKKHEDSKEPESGDSAFSDDDIPSDIDLNDPYFKEEMEQFKKKKKKNKKKTDNEEEEKEDEEEKTKKAQLELLLLDNDEKHDKHFNFKKIEEEELNSIKKKKKRQKKKEEKEVKKPVDNFQIDVNDERFSAIYSSHHFNIDPADSNFKMTQGTKALIGEKLKRRAVEDPVPEESAPKIQKTSDKEKKRKAELSVLVKTIKRKTSEAQKKIKR